MGSAERLSPLAGVAATRAVLERHGLATKHALGQNFLVNDDVLRKIVALAELDAGDDVLEVGPGIGTLTVALLKRARRVVSVERDPDLPAVLAETLAAWPDRFALISKDALDLTKGDVESALARHPVEGGARSFPNKLVANLPYAVAATVVLGFFERFDEIESATVMVQKEVADRMAAAPGSKSYGAYTVKLSMRAEPAGRFTVSPGNFFPPPHVDSAVLRLNRRTPAGADGAPLAPEVVRATCTMADAAFASRRKTIANSCKAYFAGRGEQGRAVAAHVEDLLESAGISPKRRGETLDVQEFVALGEAYLTLRTR
ncbi:16S rRNA (adenine(1518)-N(6)/adenine(1519)-N(6))-dimethyltransferase RsmA [Adlercreutzia sp. ZJ473]|uniref:16S rRNA (adenine(1518)-N(6)/adenine(1519)-N(6))- dimethyltransferase RsmA n=1 Tax=Adlercreutzia sp. ZJ473 TaxID=2722822 RepID=UPI003530309C